MAILFKHIQAVAPLKKPMLAEDADLDNLGALQYPRAALIKKDGVRCLIKHTENGYRCLGRSHKEHANPHVQFLFGKKEYLGFDGEGIVGPDNAQDVCQQSSGGFSRSKDNLKEGKFVKVSAVLHVFDLHDHPGTYEQRHAAATERVTALLLADPTTPICIIPYSVVNDAEELEDFDATALDGNYEGIITRTLNGRYKNGRSTLIEEGYLRIKRFIEEEALVTSIEEGQTNTNEAKINELGHTERSSAKAGMIPNGQIGTIHGTNIKTGAPVTVSPGKMREEDAKYFWAHPEEFVGQIMKYKHFPKGVKNKLRFGTFQCLRSTEDMS